MLTVLPFLAFALAMAPAHAKPRETPRQARESALTLEAINQAQWTAPKQAGKRGAKRSTPPVPQKAATKITPLVIKTQVLLAKAGFSPGVIDGLGGDNLVKALRAFQERNGLPATGAMDEATWNAFAGPSPEDVVRVYAVTAADVEGPFLTERSRDFIKLSQLERLGYRSPAELLAEKFHSSEKLLTALNKGQPLDRADAQILVPNVEPMELAAAAPERKARRHTVGAGAAAAQAAAAKEPQAARIEVDKPGRSVRVLDREGALIAFYPASIGSADKPAPSGAFKVTSVKRNPTYRYDPAFAFKGQTATKPVKVAPGPNNPVGVAWIGISAPSYGLHGAAEPDRVGKSNSHGCVRMTNWDALALAKLVRKGTPVEFRE